MPVRIIPPTGQREIEFFTNNLQRSLRTAAQFQKLGLAEEEQRRLAIQDAMQQALISPQVAQAREQFQGLSGLAPGVAPPENLFPELSPQERAVVTATPEQRELQLIQAGLKQQLPSRSREELSPIQLIEAAKNAESVRPGSGLPFLNLAYEKLNLPRIDESNATSIGPIPSTLIKMNELDESITDWSDSAQVGQYLDQSVNELINNPQFQAMEQNEQERALNIVTKTVQDQQAIKTAVPTETGPKTIDQLLVQAAKDKFPDDPQAQIEWALEQRQDPLTQSIMKRFQKGGDFEGLKLDSVSLSGGKAGVAFKAPSSSERKQIAELRAQMGQLDDFEKLFEDTGKNLVGPISGRAAMTSFTKFGGIGLAKEQSEFLAAEATLVNYIIKLLTGAQMSEREADRIMNQIPRATDTPDQWRAKMNQTRKNANRLLQKIEEISGAAQTSRRGGTEESEADRLRKEIGLE